VSYAPWVVCVRQSRAEAKHAPWPAPAAGMPLGPAAQHNSPRVDREESLDGAEKPEVEYPRNDGRARGAGAGGGEGSSAARGPAFWRGKRRAKRQVQRRRESGAAAERRGVGEDEDAARRAGGGWMSWVRRRVGMEEVARRRRTASATCTRRTPRHRGAARAGRRAARPGLGLSPGTAAAGEFEAACGRSAAGVIGRARERLSRASKCRRAMRGPSMRCSNVQLLPLAG
jgi:hypothetical protein